MAVYLKKAQERPEQDLRAVSDLVREVLERVRLGGEAAVRYYSNKFDQWDPPSFRLSEAEVERPFGPCPRWKKRISIFARPRSGISPRNSGRSSGVLRWKPCRASIWGRRSYRWRPAVPISREAVIPCWPRPT